MVTKAFSIEDGNQTSSIIGSRKRKYTDIDLTFTPKVGGNVFKKIDAASVKQSVKNILLTNNLEKPFNSEFGADIRGLLFEIASDPDVSYQIEEDIEDALKLFEPRVTDVKVETDITNTGLQSTSRLDDNTISVKVTYRIINSEQVDVIQTTLARLR